MSQRLDLKPVGKRKFVEFGRDAFGPQWSDITGMEEAGEDESVIKRIVAVQREAVEREIAGLKAEARAAEQEIEELVGSSPF